MSNVSRFPVRTEREPNKVASIDLNRIHVGAVFVATTVTHIKYHVRRDPNPPRGRRIDPAKAHVLVTIVAFGGDVRLEEQPMHTHSIIKVGEPWHHDEDTHTGKVDSTDPIASIEPAFRDA